MFSYDPSNRILKVQKLAEEEVDLGLLEYQKESYQKYLTETIYSDMEYLLQVMRELLQVSQVDAEFRVGDLYCGNYKNEVKKKSPSYYPVYARFTIDGAVFPNEVEVFRIPAMDEDGILNFNGDRRVLLMQMVAAERVSYAADKQTVSKVKVGNRWVFAASKEGWLKATKLGFEEEQAYSGSYDTENTKWVDSIPPVAMELDQDMMNDLRKGASYTFGGKEFVTSQIAYGTFDVAVERALLKMSTLYKQPINYGLMGDSKLWVTENLYTVAVSPINYNTSLVVTAYGEKGKQYAAALMGEQS